MNTYEIQKVNDQEIYSFVVFSTTYFSPLDKLNEIEKILENKLKGKVLFDLLLSNGSASNRFIEAEFDGLKFNHRSFKIPKQVDGKIKQFSSHFYKNKEQFINSNLLSSSFKFLLQKGKV